MAPDPAALAAVLAAADLAWPGGPRWWAAVGGAEPGLVAARGRGLVARGEARPTLAVWAAGQGWLAGAGAVLIAHGLPDGSAPAEARTAHLAAGWAAARAEATAAALGLRSRPVGSWQRADLGAALGGPPGERWIVHGLAVAAPGDPQPCDTGRKDEGP
ncbi:hypothetical protein GCM10027168_74980 [Streptomyces capparidis]